MRASSLGRRHLVAVFAAFGVGLGLLFAASGVADGEEPDVTTSVVGGSAVPNGKYPFMVSLQLDRIGSSRADEHFCGGTLIGPRHVLTAGHCIKEMPITRRNYRKLRVVVGAGSGGEGACYGDSCGPLFAPKNGQYKQIGITSFGIGCATSRYRGVFAEVNSPNIRSFIRRTSGA